MRSGVAGLCETNRNGSGLEGYRIGGRGKVAFQQAGLGKFRVSGAGKGVLT